MANYVREVSKTERLLKEYVHLVEVEDIDCELNFKNLTGRQMLICHTRKYFATMISLSLITVFMMLYWKVLQKYGSK